MLKRISAVPLSTIVLLSLLLKLVFFCSISPWDNKIEKEKIVVSDSWGYEQMAENLLKYHSFTSPVDTFHISNYSDLQLAGYLSLRPDTYRMPLYPSFIAGVYLLAGIKPYLVIFLQILVSLLSVVFVYRISMLLFNRIDIAKIAALLFAIDIHSAFVANQLLTDTLFVVLFLASTYYFLKGLQNKNIVQILIGGIFIGMATLTRGVIIFYPAIIILLVLAFSKQTRIWQVKALFCYFIPFIGLAGAWSLRNDLKYGHGQLSTEEGSGILMYYVAYVDSRTTHRNIDTVRVEYQKKANALGFRNEKDVFKQSDIYKTLAVDYIKKNKAAYIKGQLLGGINMFFAIGNVGMSKILGWDESFHEESFAEITPGRVLGNFTKNKKEALLGIIILFLLAIEYFGALLGLRYLWKHKQYMFILLCLLTVAYFAATTGVVGTYRYKLPVVPFFCIAAGYGYACWPSKRKEIA